ncbi:hypothetical protein CHS0354_011962, partial [Potamilus streckersoni]
KTCHEDGDYYGNGIFHLLAAISHYWLVPCFFESPNQRAVPISRKCGSMHGVFEQLYQSDIIYILLYNFQE